MDGEGALRSCDGRRGASSLIRSSKKEKVRALTVGRGSPATLRFLKAEQFSEIPRAVSEFFIPRTVEKIGPRCFGEWEHARAVCFESGSQLQEMSDEAFAGTELRSILIPNRVHRLGESCFSECTNLWLVSFEMAEPMGLSRIWISAEAFRSSGLRWIELPPYISMLGDRCFHSLYALHWLRLKVL
jgi:hypothetical protein